MRWEDDFRDYIIRLGRNKPVVVCGDLNVAHTEIDLKILLQIKNAGFTNEEREKFTQFLDSGLIDSFRFLSGQKGCVYMVVLYVQRPF